jgi:hypothetical protein
VKLKLLSLVLLFALLLASCGQPNEPGVLYPGQVTASMVGQVIKVSGKVVSVVENPGGLGGVLVKLSDGKTEISVRIQNDIWKPMTTAVKEQFQKGRTVTVEGVLFQAGKELVVIHGQTSL